MIKYGINALNIFALNVLTALAIILQSREWGGFNSDFHFDSGGLKQEIKEQNRDYIKHQSPHWKLGKVSVKLRNETGQIFFFFKQRIESTNIWPCDAGMLKIEILFIVPSLENNLSRNNLKIPFFPPRVINFSNHQQTWYKFLVDI